MADLTVPLKVRGWGVWTKKSVILQSGPPTRESGNKGIVKRLSDLVRQQGKPGGKFQGHFEALNELRLG